MHKELRSLENKKILILGYGVEGKSTYKFIRRFFSDKLISVADKDSDINFPYKDNITIITGTEYLDKLKNFDIVFKTPGIPFDLPKIQNAQQKGVIFSSHTELFFKLCEGKIIGVTGTKGKSTTSSMINHILADSGVSVKLIGNIGNSALDYLSKDLGKDNIYVFELSSYQLDRLPYSPYISVFLNFYREHLHYHKTLKKYFGAKENIATHQKESDLFIYNYDFKKIRSLTKRIKSKTISISAGNPNADYLLRNNKIIKNNQIMLEILNNNLLGQHNLLNATVAAIVTLNLGVSKKRIKDSLESFLPLEHRLEKVRTIGNITFYNDSLSTVPEATIAALRSFTGTSKVLIMGGKDRGQDFSEVAKEICSEGNTKSIVVLGETSRSIIKELEKQNYRGEIIVNQNIIEIVKIAFQILKHEKDDNSIVLLSPAAASHDMFKNYKERGDKFKKQVNLLK